VAVNHHAAGSSPAPGAILKRPDIMDLKSGLFLSSANLSKTSRFFQYNIHYAVFT
jgi:hypothetical protein